MKTVQKQTRSLGGWAKANSKQFKMMGVAIAAMGVAALVTFKKMVKQYVETGDMIHKMALRTGFAAETLSELAYAAEISGADLSMLEKGVKKMSKTIVDASRGMETYAIEFRELGLDVNQLLAMKPEEQFLKIGAAIAAMESDTLKTSAAVNVFGRAGTMLLPLFKEGSEGINALREDAHRLGIIFDEEAAAKAAKLKDAQTALTGSVRGLSIAILNDLIPILTDVTKKFTDWFVNTREDAKTWAAGIIEFFKVIVKGIQGLSTAFVSFRLLTFEAGAGVANVTKKSLNWLEKIMKENDKWRERTEHQMKLRKKLNKIAEDAGTIEEGYRKEVERSAETINNINIEFDKLIGSLDSVGEGLKKAKKETKTFGETIVDSVLPAARNIKGVLDKVVEEFKKVPEEIEETWEDVFWKVLSAATLFTSSLGSLFDQLTTNQMARIDAEYEARKATIDNSLMTEKSKADALAKLDVETDKKRKKAQRSAAKRTKAISLMEAIVGTAAAVVQAMKVPFPLSLILPIIIGAMGAAQIALIAAQPLPALAKGGRLGKGQLGIVGEEGPELFAPDTGGTVIPMREGGGLGALRPVYLTIAPSYQISTIDEVGVRDFMRDRGIPAIVEAIRVGIMKPELQDALRIK